MTLRNLRIRPSLLVAFLLVLFFIQAVSINADPITVLYQEGSVHGYLALRSLDGKILAAGDLIQTIHGQRLTSRLIYHFRDGSLDDDTAIFTQRGHFRLVSDHRIQKGPTFPHPTDVSIDALGGQVTVRYKDKNQEKVESSHLDLPPDLANGIILDVLKNVSPKIPEMKMSYLVTTPKPRLIHLSVKPDGVDKFESAGVPNKALRFTIHADLGGVTGLVAPMIGKEPPDTHVWVSSGQVPAFIKSEEPLYYGGPMLRTELVSPIWHKTSGYKPPAEK